MFSPACIHCGARLIQRIGKLPIPQSSCTARRKAVLADWMAHGHDEATIRALVKGPLAIGPVEATESDSPSQKKPSSRGRK